MARTKQTARRSRSGAKLLYRGRKRNEEGAQNIPNSGRKKVISVSSSLVLDSAKAHSQSRKRTKMRKGSVTTTIMDQMGMSMRRDSSSKDDSKSTMNSRDIDTSVSSLTEALSKLGSSSSSSSTSSFSSLGSNYATSQYFSNSSRALGIIKDVCGAFDGIPYVKAVAAFVKQIIEIIEEVQAYQDRCRALVNKVVLFAQGVFEGLLKLSRVSLSYPNNQNIGVQDQLQSLQQDLADFFRVLECIYAILQSLTTSKVTSRFLRYVSRNETLGLIEEQDRNLDTYIQYFNTRSSIALRMGLLSPSSDPSPSYQPRRSIKVRQNSNATPLYGRENELETLVQQFTNSNSQTHLAILGPGGIGKTALSLSLFCSQHIISKFGTNRYFISCTDTSSSSLDLFIHELASSLNIPTDGHTISGDKLFQVILSHLQQSPHLLILDNLESIWDPLDTRTQTEFLLSSLSSIPTVNLIITIRGSQHPGGISWSKLLPPLKPLSFPSAQLLFTKISHKEIENDEYATKLIKAVDCIPLAVNLLANLSSVYGVSNEELWERWIDEKIKLIECGNDRLSNLEVSIKVSLDCKRMKYDENGILVLCLVSVLPGGMSKRVMMVLIGELKKMKNRSLMNNTRVRGGGGGGGGGGVNLKKGLNTLKQCALVYEDEDSTPSSSSINNGTEEGRIKVLSPIRHYILAHYSLPLTRALSFKEEGDNNNNNVKEVYEIMKEYFLELACKGGERVVLIYEDLKDEIGNVEEMVVRGLKESMFLEFNGDGNLNGGNDDDDERMDYDDDDDEDDDDEMNGSGNESGDGNWNWRNVEDVVGGAVLGLAEFMYISGVGSCVPLEKAVERLDEILLEVKSKTRSKLNVTSKRDLKKKEESKTLGTKLRRFLLGRTHNSKPIPSTSTSVSSSRQRTRIEEVEILKADCLGCWGQLLSRQGHYEQAKIKFEKALEIHTKIEDLAGQAADFHNLGCLLVLDEAMDKFTKASKIHEFIGDKVGLTYDMMGLGQIYLQRCELSKAKEVFEIGLKNLKELGDVVGQVTAMNNLGHTLSMWNKFEEAERWFEKAIELNKDLEVGDLIGKSDSLCGLASTLLLRSRFDEAEKCIRKAMELKKPFEDADQYHVLGRILCANWKLDEAVKVFEYLRDLVRDKKDMIGCANDLKYLTYTRFLLGKVEGGLEILEEVERMYVKVKNEIGVAEVKVVKGEVLLQLGKFREAEESASTALEKMRDMDCKLGEAQALYVLGCIALEEKKTEEATKKLEDALVLHKEVGSVQGVADDLLKLAEVVIDDELEAIKRIDEAMELHTKIGDKSGQGDGWYLRGIIYKDKDMFIRAVELHREAQVVYKEERDRRCL